MTSEVQSPVPTIAVTREVPRTIAACELTHVERAPIDLALARRQHAEYERALEAAGCTIRRLPELPDHPDSVFIEDVAVILDEVAVLTRPGAASRQGEVDHVEGILASCRPVRRLAAPATLDGGDVLRLGRTLWVGCSARTNAEGIRQLGECVAPFGYQVRHASLRDALHLKTAVTQVGEETLLANPAWVEPRQFGPFDVVAVDPAEPFAANAVWVNGNVVHSTAFPRTQEQLRARNISVLGVDVSELAKAEGGVTCCALLVAG